MSEPVAAIDCGTNTVRLLISRDGVDLERRQVVTGIGKGVDRTGRLDPSAVDRTIAVLAEYRQLLDKHEVSRARMVATSASRGAANRDDFFGRIQATLGVTPELLSAEDEGRLTYRGATAGLSEPGPFCVIDLGGGSTEFAVGEAELDRVVSVDMGSVRFTDRYVKHDPPWPEELLNCISVTEAHLADVIRELPELGGVNTFVGVAGTITTMASVEIGSDVNDREVTHHFRLTHDAAEDVYRTLVTEAFEDRIHNPGLARDRADVIVGGAAILVAIMRTLGIDPLIVSERDLLDGIVAELA